MKRSELYALSFALHFHKLPKGGSLKSIKYVEQAEEALSKGEIKTAQSHFQIARSVAGASGGLGRWLDDAVSICEHYQGTAQ